MAVTEARRELGFRPIQGSDIYNDRNFGTPVIYLRSERSIISPLPPKGVAHKKDKGKPKKERVPKTAMCPKCSTLLPSLSEGYCYKCHSHVLVCPKCNQFLITAEDQFCFQDADVRGFGSVPASQIVAAPSSFPSIESTTTGQIDLQPGGDSEPPKGEFDTGQK